MRTLRKLATGALGVAAAAAALVATAPPAAADNISRWHYENAELRPGTDRSLCLDHGGSRTTGTVPTLQPCNGSAAQRWWIVDVRHPTYGSISTYVTTAYPSNGDFMYYDGGIRDHVDVPYLRNPSDVETMPPWEVKQTAYTPFMLASASLESGWCLDSGLGAGQAPRLTSPCSQDNNNQLWSGI